jgi:dTDP-4-amino-4,6-dideoxygalactose transaminase
MTSSIEAGEHLRTGERVPVPFFDPAPMHAPLKDAILHDLEELLDSGAFINGPWVRRFEEEFASYCGTTWCVGVASGLDALRLSLLAGGIEPRDEVIVPANTFVATLEAVSQAGGVPVVVDVNEADRNIAVEAVEAAITSRTRFVVPVHLYGQMADMRGLTQLAERTGVELLEDACQAHGAVRDGLRAGSVGCAGAFSFYPAKNLGAAGDAGAYVTNDEELAIGGRILREHGQRRKYEHEAKGYTARLDSIQALFLMHKLPHLDRWNAERVAAAAFYTERLCGIGDLRLPATIPNSEPVWHLYVVRTADPAALSAFLRERGIGTSRHYPETVHLAGAYQELGHVPGAFPVAERLAREILSVPIFPGISEEQLEAVGDAIEEFFVRG